MAAPTCCGLSGFRSNLSLFIGLPWLPVSPGPALTVFWLQTHRSGTSKITGPPGAGHVAQGQSWTGGGVETGQAWPQALAGCPRMPRWAATLDRVEGGRAWFPGQGSKQVRLVANYTGNQQAPKEASWAGLGP